MRKAQLIRQQSFLVIASLALILAFVLSACGANSGGTGGGTSPTPTPTFTTVKGYGSSHGCPSDVVVTGTPAAPNVVARVTDNNSTIMAHTGNIVEVDLPFNQRWMGPTSSVSMLQLQMPAGYAWKVKNACIWRFVAQGTGTTQLHFEGRALCLQGQLCPQYVLKLEFTVVVS